MPRGPTPTWWGLMQRPRDLRMHPQLVELPFADDGAEEAWEDFPGHLARLVTLYNGQGISDIIERAAAIALRVATLRSMSRPYERPIEAALTFADIRWGCAVA